MPLFAFRAMTALHIANADPVAAGRTAGRFAAVLSGLRHGRGVTHVDLEASPGRGGADLFGGYCCPMQGHVSVQARDDASAREIVQAWKRVVMDGLSGQGISFVRFDLHPL